MYNYLKNNTFILSVCSIILISIGIFIYAVSSNKNLEIVFLDVGQGDATLITTPSGRQILIDTGPKPTIGKKLSPHMNISDRSLDMVILTHSDLDHVGGMISLINRYDIDLVIHSGLMVGSSIYAAIAENINEYEIPAIAATMGQIIQLDRNLYLEVLGPTDSFASTDTNDYSVIVRLVYGNTSVLLTGDASDTIEYDLVDTFGEHIKSDILKVGHHGSQTSSAELFLETVSPEYGIVSAGCDNRFGHPHGAVLANLFSAKIQVLDTCNEGDIIFESDGEEWIRN